MNKRQAKKEAQMVAYRWLEGLLATGNWSESVKFSGTETVIADVYSGKDLLKIEAALDEVTQQLFESATR
jgi:hypothetical protein